MYSDNQLRSKLSFARETGFLSVNNLGLTDLPPLPPNLTGLHCSNNQLLDLPDLPSTLLVLRCDSNRLRELPALPEHILEVDCSFNYLSHLPPLAHLPLQSLTCEYNYFQTMCDIPDSLTVLRARNNPWNRHVHACLSKNDVHSFRAYCLEKTRTRFVCRNLVHMISTLRDVVSYDVLVRIGSYCSGNDTSLSEQLAEGKASVLELYCDCPPESLKSRQTSL